MGFRSAVVAGISAAALMTLPGVPVEASYGHGAALQQPEQHAPPRRYRTRRTVGICELAGRFRSASHRSTRWRLPRFGARQDRSPHMTPISYRLRFNAADPENCAPQRPDRIGRTGRESDRYVKNPKSAGTCRARGDRSSNSWTGAAPAGASETATRVSEGLSGSVMTPEQMEVFACSKGGYNESIGWARCSGTHRFKVRVWCTWAGQGSATRGGLRTTGPSATVARCVKAART